MHKRPHALPVMPKQRLSCAILTLNEANRIRACVNSISACGITDIRVYDGGSTDGTVRLATGLGCKVRSLPESSISDRRSRAISDCDTEFLLFVDADQRLDMAPINGIVADHFSDPNVAGVQFSLRVDAPNSYCERGFALRHRLITGEPGKRVVIGTPCIFRASAVRDVGYDSSLTGGSDDTALGHALTSRGYDLACITASAREQVRATWSDTLKKAYWYGLSDAEYCRAYPDKARNHTFHVIVRNGIMTPVRIAATSPTMWPFFQAFGVARSAGFVRARIRAKNLLGTRS